MVWLLEAVDAAVSPSAYYLKSAATYSVGRKDCYITIQKDKSISRVHAQLITEEARASKKDVHDVADIPRMPLKVQDLSKFGTFVNKVPDSKPVASSGPDKEAPLNDGDVVTFGTLQTSFRVQFIPFFLCVSSANEGKENPTGNFARRHGAYVVDTWKEGCTHVLVDEGSAVSKMVIAAVACSKPIVQINWWQKFSTETAVTTEILPYSSYLPTLVLNGKESSTPVKIALPDSRKSILQDFTILLGPTHLYEHGKHLIQLLEASGGTVEFISNTPLSKQPGEKQHLVVKPRDGALQEGWGSVRFLDNVAHLPRTSEEKLVLAVLVGHIDATKLSLPASPVASEDTDETREELDAEVDHDTAGTYSIKAIESTPPPSPQEAKGHHIGTSPNVPINLDDDNYLLQNERASKRQREHEISSGKLDDGSPEAFDASIGKRQKIDNQDHYETPKVYTRHPKKVTSSGALKELDQKQDKFATKRKPQTQTVGSGTIEKYFSQNDGNKTSKVVSQAILEDIEGAVQVPSGIGRSPFVSSSRRELGSQPIPKAEGSSKDVGTDSTQAVQADIIFSKLVVLKEVTMVSCPKTSLSGSVPNFKRFAKKTHLFEVGLTQNLVDHETLSIACQGLGVGLSGNTFTTLIPFAKEPYRDSDLGRERNEFMQQERKRKEAETLADDLFNAEKLKRSKPMSRTPARK